MSAHDEAPITVTPRRAAVTDAPAPAQKAATNYLTIVETDETFPYTFDQFEGTSFELRLVPEDLHKKWKREHTKARFDHGTRTEVTDWNALADVSLFYAVVRINGLRQSVRGEPVELKWDDLDTAKRGALWNSCRSGARRKSFASASVATWPRRWATQKSPRGVSPLASA